MKILITIDLFGTYNRCHTLRGIVKINNDIESELNELISKLESSYNACDSSYQIHKVIK
jgi:hypothetical protein